MNENPITAEHVPGIGWMYVTEVGRFGSFETEGEAIIAGTSARNGWRNVGLHVQGVTQGPADLARLQSLYSDAEAAQMSEVLSSCKRPSRLPATDPRKEYDHQQAPIHW